VGEIKDRLEEKNYGGGGDASITQQCRCFGLTGGGEKAAAGRGWTKAGVTAAAYYNCTTDFGPSYSLY
jgi:hypothetical protein